jgi:hypothetical protein
LGLRATQRAFALLHNEGPPPVLAATRATEATVAIGALGVVIACP